MRPIPPTASKAAVPESNPHRSLRQTLQRAVLDNLTYIQARLPTIRRSQLQVEIACIERGRIVGASVGDSSAWIISPAGELTDLTARQRRRPLLGSGEALPVQFEGDLSGGRLSSPVMVSRSF